MSKHNDTVYLRHMIDAAGKIGELVSRGGRELFDEDFAIADAIVRELGVIGEAARNVSPEFRTKQTQIPWKEAVGMRNWLIHGYAEIDWGKVWNTAVRDVPILKKLVEEILEGEGKK